MDETKTPGIWPGATGHGRDLTDEEIDEVLRRADENMPSFPELLDKFADQWRASALRAGLVSADPVDDDNGDDDPDDPWFG